MNLQNLIDYCEIRGLESPFAGAVVPDPLNLNICLSAIMVRCGLLTPVYNDPDTFRNATTLWFLSKQWMFEHLINIVQAEYSPIENVDRHDSQTTEYGKTNTKSGGYKDTEGGKDTVSLSGTDTVAQSGTDTVALSGTDQRDIVDGGTDTTTNTISAFNSSTYQPDNESGTTYGKTVDDDITYGKSEDTTYGKSEDTTYGKSEDTTYGHNLTRVYNNEKDTEGGKDVFTQHLHGNIGVTTNQDLINQELDLLRHFDVYKFIAEQFESDNMIMIY